MQRLRLCAGRVCSCRDVPQLVDVDRENGWLGSDCRSGLWLAEEGVRQAAPRCGTNYALEVAMTGEPLGARSARPQPHIRLELSKWVPLSGLPSSASHLRACHFTCSAESDVAPARWASCMGESDGQTSGGSLRPTPATRCLEH